MRFEPAESRLRAQRLLKRRNYSIVKRIRAMLRGLMLRKFDGIDLPAIGRLQTLFLVNLTPDDRLLCTRERAVT